MPGRLSKLLYVTVAQTLAGCCWAAPGTSAAAYWATMAVAAAVVIGAIFVAWRLVDLMRLRHAADQTASVVDTSTDLKPASSEGAVAQLLEVLQLQDGMVLYVVRLGDRVVLLARYADTVVSAGDFPATWLGQPATAGTSVYRPVAAGETDRQQRHPPVERLVRDEEQWRRQRDALIRLLQEQS